MSTFSLSARYRLIGLLGEGGSGRVYRVHDAVRSRDLALKLVTPDESDFLRGEFDTLRQIRHENLIQVFDWGALPSGESYYTMELIEGEDWGRRMGTAQNPEEVRRILTGILRGLAHLHCHREIHGDLKPGNVLLGLGGVVKLTDVGMGRGDGTARASGTPGYAAPEVWEGSSADSRSDLYSVGVMAYEALTGVHPFQGRTIREVVAGQLEGWVPSPGVHGVRVPADLERVVMRALERERGLRQGSADELMEGMAVEDRIGQILGGKFVGRLSEATAISEAIFSERPGSPSLIYLVGPPLVGRKALVNEVGHRIAQRGGMVISLGEDLVPSEEWGAGPGAIAEPTPAGATGWQNIGRCAERLLDLGRTTPVLVRRMGSRVGMSAGHAFARNLARYLWARSMEMCLPARVVLIECTIDAPQGRDDFEEVIELQPFSREDVRELLNGRIGEAEFEAELLDAIHHLTGGFPGALETLLPSLVERGLIERRRGTWIFRESERLRAIDIAQLPSPWSRGWDKLSPEATRVLQVLSLVPGGLPGSFLQSLSAGSGDPAVLASLAASGWVTRAGQCWQVASEGIRQVVRARSGRGAIRTAARAIADRPGAIGAEEFADLALEYDHSRDALKLGLLAAARARSRGDHSLEAARLRRCLAIAEDSDPHTAQSIALDLAEALHRIGSDVEARTHLLRKSLWQHTPDGVAVARRHHILGTVEFALGQVEEAREHFERGIQSARTGRDPILEARCVAGLAEAGWQHGPESHRSEAIAVIETLIRDHGGRSDIGEEMGGLAYQLGSALVRSGEHKRAAAVLARGLEAATSDYWRMRIANALGAANYYVGRFDAALENIEMSWRLAEHIGADSFKSRILANRAGLYYGLGRPRDAVDQNKLAALWARRTGATFDYLSACAGASINLTYLARYEEAITYATNVRTVADRLGDLDEIGKGFELEALAKYHIGDNAASEELVRTALAALEGAGYLSVRPRLEWLLARVLNVQGRVREAVGYLERADAELKRTQDWEDLPGVQIELHFVHSQLGDPVKHLLAIRELAGEGRGGTPLLVFLNGALSVAEVLVRRDVQHREWMDFLSTALERAEDAAIREVAWRLCGALTTFQIRDGNKKEAHARLRRGGQLLREIADELSTAHRELYLSTRHAQSLLGAMRVE